MRIHMTDRIKLYNIHWVQQLWMINLNAEVFVSYNRAIYPTAPELLRTWRFIDSKQEQLCLLKSSTSAATYSMVSSLSILYYYFLLFRIGFGFVIISDWSKFSTNKWVHLYNHNNYKMWYQKSLFLGCVNIPNMSLLLKVYFDI